MAGSLQFPRCTRGYCVGACRGRSGKCGASRGTKILVVTGRTQDVLRPADDAWSVIEDSRADLVSSGFAPGPPEQGPNWWEEPMFCGWGAQCARSAHELHGTADLILYAVRKRII